MLRLWKKTFMKLSAGKLSSMNRQFSFSFDEGDNFIHRNTNEQRESVLNRMRNEVKEMETMLSGLKRDITVSSCLKWLLCH